MNCRNSGMCLRGDMSLVGPRPEVPRVCCSPCRNVIGGFLSVRPGITDPASLRFKNEEAILAASEDPLRYYAEVILPAKLDMAEEYIRTRSLRQDFKVLLKTALLAVPGRAPLSHFCRAFLHGLLRSGTLWRLKTSLPSAPICPLPSSSEEPASGQ